jgi:peptidoglycan/xylan/chitin deacetylase (PgdA/CDA1 family)
MHAEEEEACLSPRAALVSPGGEDSDEFLRRCFLAAACAAAALAVPAFARAATTVVSLTFDDGWANQTTAASALDAHGMKGTFYVNTNTVGTSGHLSWAQLEAFDSAGNEVTGTHWIISI